MPDKINFTNCIKITRKIIILIASFSLYYCAKSETDLVKPNIEFNNSVNNLILSQTSGSINISFNSALEWTASCDQSWCDISSSSGKAGNSTISVNVSDNTTYDDRNASIKISSGTISKIFTITQKQKDAIITGNSKIEVGGDAQTVDIEVKANVDYTIKIDEGSKSWISQNTSRGLSSKKISFNVKENESIDNREGHITISDGKLNEVVTIYQFGNKPTIILTQKEYIVPSEGEVIKIEIKSNVDYEMIVPQEEWVNENSSRAMSYYTHYINVKPNSNYDQRETNIIFKNKKNNIQESVKIIQEQKDAIIATNNKYLVQSGSCNLDIDINANVEYSVNIDVSWIKQITSRNLSAKSVHFHLEENTGENERKGIIKLSHDNLSTEIIITQKGKLNSGGGIDDMPNNKW